MSWLPHPDGDTGLSSTTMGSVPAQHTRCPGCEIRLVRNPESLIAELREWRPAEDLGPTGSQT